MTHIPESEITYSGYSILDTFGRVFFWNDQVYRGISAEANDELIQLRAIGLLDELEHKGLFPKTVTTDFISDHFSIIIRHEKIRPASFVYEWPFDMVKAAGNCVLDVNIIAAKYNYQTIDAHPYNVLFKGCKPVFIDIGSLKPIENKHSWDALEEFYGYYKYPLELWNTIGHKMARRLYSEDLTSVTTAEYNKMLELSMPKYKIKARELVKRARAKVSRMLKNDKPRLQKIETAKKALQALHKTSVKTKWGNYHDDYVVDEAITATDRFSYIINKVNELNITSVTELAGNWGLLSHLLFQHTKVDHIICTDYDENAVNKMYNHFKNTAFSEMLSPVLVDFIKPIELVNSGRPASRFKSEAVFALAVTHHLTLDYKYDLNVVLQKIADYTTKYAFVEFMPLGLWDGYTAPPIPAFYSQEWFLAKFKNHFEVVEVAHIEENRILFVGIKK